MLPNMIASTSYLFLNARAEAKLIEPFTQTSCSKNNNDLSPVGTTTSKLPLFLNSTTNASVISSITASLSVVYSNGKSRTRLICTVLNEADLLKLILDELLGGKVA